MYQQEESAGNNGPSSSPLDEVEQQLLTTGLSLSDLGQAGFLLVAPGVTVNEYIATLRIAESVEVVDGVIRYRQGP